MVLGGGSVVSGLSVLRLGGSAWCLPGLSGGGGVLPLPPLSGCRFLAAGLGWFSCQSAGAFPSARALFCDLDITGNLFFACFGALGFSGVCGRRGVGLWVPVALARGPAVARSFFAFFLGVLASLPWAGVFVGAAFRAGPVSSMLWVFSNWMSSSRVLRVGGAVGSSAAAASALPFSP